MGKWKQISGDMGWDKYGCLLAKVNTSSRDVDLVKIESWIELDSSAIRTHGLWVVEHGTVDYSDLGVDNKDVRSAIQSVGIATSEYKKLPVEGKAQILVEYQGLGGESTSVNDLMKALPDKPENITFWHGKETEESIQSANVEMRREALDSAFETGGSFPEMPEDEALEFILGDDEWEFQLDDNSRTGLGYAQLFGAPKVDLDVRSGKLTIRSVKEFTKLVSALAAAPLADKLVPNDYHKIERYLGYQKSMSNEEEKEEIDRMADEMATSAYEAAENLMSEIGFNWRVR